VANIELVKASAALKRRSPQEWSDFMAAFQIFTDTNRDMCISSSLDTLPVAQGRAQNCVALLRLFKDCIQVADQIQEKRK
jgi:hypothetical protein